MGNTDKGSPAADPRWYPWNAVGSEAHGIQEAWRLANEWLIDFGIDLVCDHAMPPDAMAYTDKAATYAFRLDQYEGGPSVFVTVEIDEDPPARCIRVEVKRG